MRLSKGRILATIQQSMPGIHCSLETGACTSMRGLQAGQIQSRGAMPSISTLMSTWPSVDFKSGPSGPASGRQAGRKVWLKCLAGVGLALTTALPAQAFDLQAHRGGRGLLPENTLVAFENAIRIGVTTIELDIAITADGVPVISHDPALNPAFTRDADGAWLKSTGPLIKQLTLAQVQSYDVGRIDPQHAYARAFPDQQPVDGQRIPTLAQLFKRVKELGANRLHFDIETKINPHRANDTLEPEAFVKALLAVIREHGMTRRVIVQSFDWRSLELLHRLEPELRTMYLSSASGNFNTVQDPAWTAGHVLSDFEGSVPRMVRASAGKAVGVIWAPHFNQLTAALAKEAQALGLQVIPWTVNKEADMERLIDWGVDGIISDYPDRLRAVMSKRGLSLPPGLHN